MLSTVLSDHIFHKIHMLSTVLSDHIFHDKGPVSNKGWTEFLLRLYPPHPIPVILNDRSLEELKHWDVSRVYIN